ncbi:MICAL-like protein 1 isoform X1 [Helicoverpa zea]|uniref:MICAL-like protein 1 isoform X1 n=1 Tax=Helicoverpa zea TaxID=7113 RepID=UPI001F5AC087|nr:MICAL-like protein 1 isoform X1 [Helicoverpa zea]XP_047020902.1 MICAL-like protein 1 isoform X1 [Helicoverpa zea]
MSERKGTKALELWCKRLVKDCPEVQIDNMTTSWRNGIAFCALVHHFRPDLIDMSKLNPENIYENNHLAYSVAEKHLGIPSLLDPEDMVENDVPDRLSILTYLSQFYQRLGHTVNTKLSESESKVSPQTTTTETSAPIRFGKTGLDKCAACGLPVYLAQRLLVSHKLYHRRCFRCSKCSGHLNPKNFEIVEGSEFTCDSCKNEKTLSKYLNNNDHDQMGMLAFTDTPHETKSVSIEEPPTPKYKSRPQSILDKINMFEKNIEKDSNLENKISNISLKDTSVSNPEEISSTSSSQCEIDSKPKLVNVNKKMENETVLSNNIPEKVYKSNIEKFNFLQTQLADDNISVGKSLESIDDIETQNKDCIKTIEHNTDKLEDSNDVCSSVHSEVNNETDDNRIANSSSTNIDYNHPLEQALEIQQGPEISISVPPRRKKQNALEKALASAMKKEKEMKMETKEYPDHLNPFSDDEEEENTVPPPQKISTNPFGSSDEEDDDVPPIQSTPKSDNTPIKRLIAVNPFWSDGEEPSSDDDDTHNKSSMYRSSMATSTPNLPGSTPRRKKAKAPPPPTIAVTEAPRPHYPSTSMDDVASISSFSSYNSTVNSDQKSIGKCTPTLKRRPAPTPPGSLSTASGGGGSLEKGINTSGMRSIGSEGGRKAKGPAPGLPLPERREVKLQMSPEELQVQLDLLETQQLGLERQGVLIERMIRDKCEGDEADTVPQEEVEDLVIQLCELVNEKNYLFRKQTELMYIRRQQRLEQEQADIEHEIRIIQSRPAVNRIDADKAREEKLVLRLVEIVRMRDELVQQIDAERRRERQEDLAIAASIASKRAQRNSESNSSSMKSVEVIPTPKKSKVKDKVKKQLKKAKHTLIAKKKEDSGDRKEEKEKEKKVKQ